MTPMLPEPAGAKRMTSARGIDTSASDVTVIEPSVVAGAGDIVYVPMPPAAGTAVTTAFAGMPVP